MNANTSNPSVDAYLNGRWKEQSNFFEAKAASNKKMFIWTRRLGFFAGIFTPIIIFVVVALSVDPSHKSPFAHYYHLIPAVVSLIAVGSYQWEELHNYGAQWAKYRLVAEKLKGHRELFLQKAGHYRNMEEADALRQFVEACEALIEGTDVNYFVLMVDPLRRQDQ
jgi:uncharacterized protein DUF4231